MPLMVNNGTGSQSTRRFSTVLDTDYKSRGYSLGGHPFYQAAGMCLFFPN